MHQESPTVNEHTASSTISKKTHRVTVFGGSGFIGSHIAESCKQRGYHVTVVDIHACRYKSQQEICDTFYLIDLTREAAVDILAAKIEATDWAFLLAADMGGMGYIQGNDARIVKNNTAITRNVIDLSHKLRAERLFVASSACVYPTSLQSDSEKETIKLKEEDAWLGFPQDGYGLEKIYAEKVAEYAGKNSEMQIRIARFHNIYGPACTWYGGREKAPAAFLRKLLCYKELASSHHLQETEIEIWGDGTQRRSFCYIDDAVDAVFRLMGSDYDSPLNIGSEEDIGILELYEACARTAGFSPASTPRITLKLDGPRGVASRTSDNARIQEVLAWRPQTSLVHGLRTTFAFIKAEHQKIKEAVFGHNMDVRKAENEWFSFNQLNMASSHRLHHINTTPVYRFAILIPLTSRECTSKKELETQIKTMVRSFNTSTSPPTDGGESQFEYHFFYGVDEGDIHLDPFLPEAINLMELTHSTMPLRDVEVSTHRLSFAEGHVCDNWRSLSAIAFHASYDFYLLIGDDVVFDSLGWPQVIVRTFEQIATDRHVPFGFGCVAFHDLSFPGFPSFPVLHKTHFEIFGGQLVPPGVFINQSLDPFIFQLYRRFGCSHIAIEAQIRNAIGGCGSPRYSKTQPTILWKGDLLTLAVSNAAEYLKNVCEHPQSWQTITLDVIVPTFRADKVALDRILSLKAPEELSVMFIVIFDNMEPAAVKTFEQITEEHKSDPFCRLRKNSENLGAPASRNVGLDESAGEWMLFLDDDIVPDKQLLCHYSKAIKAHPNAFGFLGPSKLPTPVNISQEAVVAANVTFFWDIATCFPKEMRLPWGVTANVLVRRDPTEQVRFKTCFPKTGGGEDVDFCLQMRKRYPTQKGFVSVPEASVTHPWWDNGSPNAKRFVGWAIGDGALVDLYPEHVYCTYPDLAECLIILKFSVVFSSCAFLVILFRAVIFAPEDAMKHVSYFSVILVEFLVMGIPCVVFDFCYELFELRKKHSTMAILRGLVIKTRSQAGRITGHADRGKAIKNLCHRFNWFGDFDRGKIQVEHRRAALLFFGRIVLSMVVYSLFGLMFFF